MKTSGEEEDDLRGGREPASGDGPRTVEDLARYIEERLRQDAKFGRLMTHLLGLSDQAEVLEFLDADFAMIPGVGRLAAAWKDDTIQVRVDPVHGLCLVRDAHSRTELAESLCTPIPLREWLLASNISPESACLHASHMVDAILAPIHTYVDQLKDDPPPQLAPQPDNSRE